jgi:excinuclease ABC subunit A
MNGPWIRIVGARKHNLKNIEVQIPRNKITVITGVSGSGKSSLAIDTLFAEARRRYFETLSIHARQLLRGMESSEVDLIEGLSPAIAIDQGLPYRNPRATVGTLSEAYELLRLLFAKVAKPHCPRCGMFIGPTSIQKMRDRLYDFRGTRAHIYAPFFLAKAKEKAVVIKELLRAGYLRAKVGGELLELEDMASSGSLESLREIYVLVDRVDIEEGSTSRVVDSLEVAAKLGKGAVVVEIQGGQSLSFVQRPMCLECEVELPEASLRLFSFNDPHGSCPACRGLGVEPLQGKGIKEAELEEIGEMPQCSACGGSRLREEARAYKIGGFNLWDLCNFPLEDLGDVIQGLPISKEDEGIAKPIIAELRGRISAMVSLGLGYLTLGRSVETLSSGEIQRIRLSTQMNSSLVGILYVMDEPSVGLHPADQERLMEILRGLRDAGNTLVVVEHDLQTILASDWVVDMGPGAGDLGGNVLYSGPPQELAGCEVSITADYLGGRRKIALPERRRSTRGKAIELFGVRKHNLKGIDVRIPLGCFVCVTGVSGSGKSTLVMDVLYRASKEAILLKEGSLQIQDVGTIKGLQWVKTVVRVDQSPIGRTPRSNPATFMGLFRHIREIFSQLPEARVRGYGPDRFSFNVKGGRCEECSGEGVRAIEMAFLPDMYVTCEACGGKRYNEATLEVRYKGLNIAEVLDLTVKEALGLFINFPRLASMLRTLQEIGLGYLRLGQPAPSLSRGEAQRLRLGRELCKSQRGDTLYVLDEPTTGLHLEDVKILLALLQELVDSGNTVVAIEHNLDFIKCADYILDLGPGAGEKGGWIVAQGTPEEVALNPRSITGSFLKEVLR